MDSISKSRLEVFSRGHVAWLPSMTGSTWRAAFIKKVYGTENVLGIQIHNSTGKRKIAVTFLPHMVGNARISSMGMTWHFQKRLEALLSQVCVCVFFLSFESIETDWKVTITPICKK